MSMKLPKLPSESSACELKVLNAGFYQASLYMLKKGYPKQNIWGPALFYLIKHPQHGYFLFDTGYSTRFYDTTRFFPYRLLRWATPVRITQQENAVEQLRSMKIHPSEVKIILSHMHVDHVGGVLDFPDAQIIVNKAEWEFTRRSSWRLFKDFYIKKLFDKIALEQVQLIDFERAEAYGPFPQAVDLFQDRSMILIPLPGHALGQMGLLLHTEGGKRYFLIADAVYVRDNYREGIGGGGISRFAHYDYSLYQSHFSFLQRLEQENSELIILPSHDPEVYRQYVEGRKS